MYHTFLLSMPCSWYKHGACAVLQILTFWKTWKTCINFDRVWIKANRENHFLPSGIYGYRARLKVVNLLLKHCQTSHNGEILVLVFFRSYSGVQWIKTKRDILWFLEECESILSPHLTIPTYKLEWSSLIYVPCHLLLQ